MTRSPTNAESTMSSTSCSRFRRRSSSRRARGRQATAGGRRPKPRARSRRCAAVPLAVVADRLAHEQTDLVETFLDAAGNWRRTRAAATSEPRPLPDAGEARVVAAAPSSRAPRAPRRRRSSRAPRDGRRAAAIGDGHDPPSRPADPGAGVTLPRPASRLAPQKPGGRRKAAPKGQRVATSRRSVRAAGRDRGREGRGDGGPHRLTRRSFRRHCRAARMAAHTEARREGAAAK